MTKVSINSNKDRNSDEIVKTRRDNHFVHKQLEGSLKILDTTLKNLQLRKPKTTTQILCDVRSFDRFEIRIKS